jgi:hypothetical protein
MKDTRREGLPNIYLQKAVDPCRTRQTKTLITFCGSLFVKPKVKRAAIGRTTTACSTLYPVT